MQNYNFPCCFSPLRTLTHTHRHINTPTHKQITLPFIDVKEDRNTAFIKVTIWEDAMVYEVSTLCIYLSEQATSHPNRPLLHDTYMTQGKLKLLAYLVVQLQVSQI